MHLRTSSLEDQLNMLLEFHEKYNAHINASPGFPPADVQKVRLTLIKEEVEELEQAQTSNDLVGVLDALMDITYLVVGTMISYGFHHHFIASRAFAEVHASNMSKLGEDGKPILREDGKILKGPNYFPPRLNRYLPGF